MIELEDWIDQAPTDEEEIAHYAYYAGCDYALCGAYIKDTPVGTGEELICQECLSRSYSYDDRSWPGQ